MHLDSKGACRDLWRCLVVAASVILAPIARGDLWCTGYYPGWEQDGMPPSQIDFAALTHLIHFSVVPNSNGSLNSSVNGITSSRSADIVATAHAAGRKVLICVGGAGSQAGFQGATSVSNLPGFIGALTNLVAARGYDGIDVDWEPLEGTDAVQYGNFVAGLRAALDGLAPRRLLTAAIASPPTPPSLVASVQNAFDQINLMTYDLSGPYPGWVTWFNAPIYDGGFHFPSTGGLVPSADGMINSVVNGGVPASKLGIGIAFYGWVWSGGAGTSTGGASQPRQTWLTAPSTTQISYNSIMSTYYQPNLYHWDTSAQAAWLGIDSAGSNSDRFISYDDERTCQSKVSFARNRGLGGVMVWEIAQDHHAGQPDPLLQAVKQALATPGALAIEHGGQAVQLSFAGIPLGSYRVQWASNPAANIWNTLTITNVSGTGVVVRVTDSIASGPTNRFYRISTPP